MMFRRSPLAISNTSKRHAIQKTQNLCNTYKKILFRNVSVTGYDNTSYLFEQDSTFSEIFLRSIIILPINLISIFSLLKRIRRKWKFLYPVFSRAQYSVQSTFLRDRIIWTSMQAMAQTFYSFPKGRAVSKRPLQLFWWQPLWSHASNNNER